MLEKFTEWVNEIAVQIKQQNFDVEVTSVVNYFTKMSIDSDHFVSEIVYWSQADQYVAEIIDVSAGQTIFNRSGDFKKDESFSIFFSDFFSEMNITIE
ncbi:immunity protein TriTu family protein [Aquirhabdus parva]|uniref:Uncharacterized protein n=1 Tax=Aquirhabdus parva TaxID=2283318 RepID=A0A345P9H5_9GAMM|nr:hypothetical protein [Aquirhabdus parva]AXI03934.1 hypothetical protein HYN46_14460 [Aquirhabdus parva]